MITSRPWLARLLIVCASSWVHGVSWVLLSSELFERAILSLFMTSSLKPFSVTSSCTSKWNRSLLLLSTCRENFQFRGRGVPLTIFICFPCPTFDLVADLMLWNALVADLMLYIWLMPNITHKVLPAVLLEIVSFLW